MEDFKNMVKINVEIDAMRFGIKRMILENFENFHELLNAEIDRLATGEQVQRTIKLEVEKAFNETIKSYLTYGDGKLLMEEYIGRKLKEYIGGKDDG